LNAEQEITIVKTKHNFVAVLERQRSSKFERDHNPASLIDSQPSFVSRKVPSLEELATGAFTQPRSPNQDHRQSLENQQLTSKSPASA
jgi:hypothetical protein